MDSVGKTIVGYEMTNLICFFTTEGGYKFFEPDIPQDEFGLSEKIYLFGNHGAFWEEHGKTKGYA